MATIREWLTEAEFDWEAGHIIYHKITRVEDSILGWQRDDAEVEEEENPGWLYATGAEYISRDHPILDRMFSCGYGGPKCPRFVAKDKEAIYFPAMYDGTTWLAKVWLDLDKYLDYDDYPTPYVGGDQVTVA